MKEVKKKRGSVLLFPLGVVVGVGWTIFVYKTRPEFPEIPLHGYVIIISFFIFLFLINMIFRKQEKEFSALLEDYYKILERSVAFSEDFKTTSGQVIDTLKENEAAQSIYDWEQAMTQLKNPKDLKTVRLIVEKFMGKSNLQAYRDAFPGDNISDESKNTGVAKRKAEAEALAKKLGLPLPEWDSRKAVKRQYPFYKKYD